MKEISVYNRLKLLSVLRSQKGGAGEPEGGAGEPEGEPGSQLVAHLASGSRGAGEPESGSRGAGEPGSHEQCIREKLYTFESQLNPFYLVLDEGIIYFGCF